MVKFIYGSHRKIPHYIREDTTNPSDGVPDYDWEYGKEGFFSS